MATFYDFLRLISIAPASTLSPILRSYSDKTYFLFCTTAFFYLKEGIKFFLKFSCILKFYFNFYIIQCHPHSWLFAALHPLSKAQLLRSCVNGRLPASSWHSELNSVFNEKTWERSIKMNLYEHTVLQPKLKTIKNESRIQVVWKNRGEILDVKCLGRDGSRGIK